MALPDYLRWTQGTAVIWGEAGASGVTNTLTFEALATGAARQAAFVDLGASWEQEYIVQMVIETGTAPTAGLTAELYLASAWSTSFLPAGMSNSDAAYKAGEEAEWLRQLGLGPDYVLTATNDADTVQVGQCQIWIPRARYVAPIVYNRLGQAVRDEATATNNDSRVILVPKSLAIQDT